MRSDESKRRSTGSPHLSISTRIIGLAIVIKSAVSLVIPPNRNAVRLSRYNSGIRPIVSSSSRELVLPRKVLSNSQHGRNLRLFSSSSAGSIQSNQEMGKLKAGVTKSNQEMGKLKAGITKVAMSAFIVSMCLTIPVALLPILILNKAKIISNKRRHHLSLRAGEFCARWCLRLIPFAKVTAISCDENKNLDEPSVWVCNHTSMLDVFFLMAMDKKLRGRRKRPMKIIYWKQLEDNPICNVLFRMSGFIPVEMKNNKPGEPNEYDRKGFKALLKNAKQAFDDGFDIGVLPEGQLNPHTETGLLPIFSGAYTLAKMSKRPIRMMALNGPNLLWHPDDDMGKYKVKGRGVNIRTYPGRKYTDPADFAETFSTVVGHFGKFGKDLPEEDLGRWLNGTEWSDRVSSEEEKVIL